MRRHVRSTQLHRTPSVSEPTAGPSLPGRAVEALSHPGGRLVRFPCGHMDAEALYFVSHDLDEPPHVHVDRDDQSAKFWLAPVALARNLGFTAVELRRVQRLVAEHEPRLLEAWNEYFRGSAG